jgi:hypothetical protein
MIGGERRDLALERVDLITPSAVEDDDGTPFARVPIGDADR